MCHESKILYHHGAIALFTKSWCCADNLHAADAPDLKSAGCKTEYFLLQDLTKVYTDKTGIKFQLGNTGNKKAVNLLMDNKIDFVVPQQNLWVTFGSGKSPSA